MTSPFPSAPVVGGVAALVASLSVSGCRTVTAIDYDAQAVTTYTWQAEYRPQGVSSDRPRNRRVEQFSAALLVNRNGERPAAAVGEADAQGLWWPPLPPRPTVDDLEARRQGNEVFSEPTLTKSVEYRITFTEAGRSPVTLPTRYDVYRQAVIAHETGRSLTLTLGPQNQSVLKAEPQP